jgi:hypothetical protein
MVSAFPTFLFFIKGSKVAELKGANAGALTALLVEWKAKAGPAAFSGTGAALGGSGGSRGPVDVRAARLAHLGAGGPATSAASGVSTGPASVPAVAAAPVAAASKAPSAAFSPAPQLQSLLLDMGIAAPRAWRALEATANASVEAALEWLEQHQDDAGLDDPIPASGAAGGSASTPSAAAAAAVQPVPTSAPHGDGTGPDGAITADDNAAVAAAQSDLTATGSTRKLSLEEVSALLAKRRAEKVRACL